MEHITDNKKFSVFQQGHRNNKGVAVLATKPQQNVDIQWVYEYIISERAKWATETLRSMMGSATKEELADFKKLQFEIVTFNGIFTYRNAYSLKMRSPYVVLDIDDLASTEEARQVQQQLIGDTSVETALCFLSPKGKGVKWVVTLPEWAQSPCFKTSYDMLRHYVGFSHGIVVDKTGSDVCRACFLPHDPQCYMNPKYL